MKQDRQLTCVDCKQDFIFPVRDQEFFEQHGWNDPIRCKKCQKARKEKYANRKQRSEPFNSIHIQSEGNN